MHKPVYIGYEELCYGRPDATDEPGNVDEDVETRFLSLRNSVCCEPHEHEEQIASYLEKAPSYGAMGCIVGDVLNPSQKAVLFPGTRTDGHFIWPAELSYYVRKYHVRIPPDLVERMASLGWQPPANDEVDWQRLGL